MSTSIFPSDSTAQWKASLTFTDRCHQIDYAHVELFGSGFEDKSLFRMQWHKVTEDSFVGEYLGILEELNRNVQLPYTCDPFKAFDSSKPCDKKWKTIQVKGMEKDSVFLKNI